MASGAVDHDNCDPLVAAVDMIAAGVTLLQSAPVNGLTHPELLAQLDRLKELCWALPAVEHAMVSRLVAEASPAALGGTSMANVLAMRLRISLTEARRRIRHAEILGERPTLSGELLMPQLPNTAASQARGQLGGEHVCVIERFFDHLPVAVDASTRTAAEATLADLGTRLGPAQLRQAADRLGYLLDQDGTRPTDVDQARRRSLIIGRQQADGLSEVSGWLDPQARATLDAVLAKLAAPGMCNPDDQSPQLEGQPSVEAVNGDSRTPAQRNHDALTAMGRLALVSQRLGTHNGLPVTIIVSTTLQELQAGAGQAVTSGGTLLSMADTIRLAAHAHHYLAVFDQHTGVPLYLGRSQRSASPGQRIVLHARDRGCTHPGCTIAGYLCQAHHAKRDWSQGGLTNVDELAFACGPHNRLVENSGWTTRKRRDGTTEWLPPPHLDTGQDRVNGYHHRQVSSPPRQHRPLSLCGMFRYVRLVNAISAG